MSSELTNLTAAGTLDGSELVYVVQGGNSRKSTAGDLAGLASPSISGVITGATQGSALFVGSGGVLAEDNANFYYDVTNKRLAVGTPKTAGAPSARGHFSSSNLVASPTVGTGVLLENTTDATAGVQQWSPGLYFRGRGWKTTATAASQTVDGRIVVSPVQGSANPTGQMLLGTSINGAAFTNILTLDSSGTVTAVGSFGCNGSFNTSSTPTSSNFWVNSAATGTQTAASGLYFGTSGNISVRTAFNGTTAYTIPANNNYGAVIVGAMAATEAASGTHPILANMIIRRPAFTNGAGASTDITTLYIEGAPTGTATSTNGNTALLIGSGNSRTNGMFSIGGGGGVSYTSWLTLGGSNGTQGVVTFTSGSYTTSPTRHTLDYDGTLWGWTNNDSVRRKMATWITPDANPALVGAVPVPTDYYGASGARILGEPDGWFETLHPDTGTAVAVPYYNLG